ncbi:receptor-like protein 50 [Benincasa hispida]|uniref:receptor-like protein 50 n=1 Tax=Benincasa hispida TaxID=102211 RepID=UPI0019020187|nr:receptor-like protein 50 [Benincasa hispida]
MEDINYHYTTMKMNPSFCSLIFLLSIIFSSTHCSPAASCQTSERSALLQFKNTFIADSSCSDSLPMVASWGVDGETDDCCSWVGVECSNQTGNVVGINLAGGCLYGSIDSNSSLFRLVHLQTLVLSDNNFSFSQIPSGIGQLSDLRHLDLGNSGFSGQIPLAISRLSKLETLRLSSVNLSSAVPDFLANMSSLMSLSLGSCGLTGIFPQKIFHLPNLQQLVLPYNPNLSGTFPEFNFNSSIQRIWLEQSAFHGEIPSSIENLKSLTSLKLGDCSFSGIVPASLGNITGLQELELHSNNFTGRIPSSFERLTELNRLFLSYNEFSYATLSWVGKQNKLVFLGLSGIGLSGTLMPSLGNLTNIVQLLLGENRLTGEIPSWIGNFAQLTDLHLYGNKLNGSIPKSFSQLTKLKHLYLQYNHLNGIVELSMFLKLENLTELHLTANDLTVLDDQVSSRNVTLPKFNLLGLGSCNLTQIPTFLENQNELEVLELGQNNIQGQIPTWMWSMSRESLKVLNLSHNALTGVEEPRNAFPWVNLYVLDLSNNRLRESFPILPAICKLSSLVALDLSSNLMSGMLPPCIGNFSSLDIMNFRENLLNGTIPDSFRNGSKLRFLDFSQNQLEGQVPRSLANCKILEIIDLSDNQFTDVFPFWIGTLPMLRLLILRSNHFHGQIEEPETNMEFPMLRIVDFSYNNFSGNLPLKYITNSKGMEIFNTTASTYRNTFVTFAFDYVWALEFFYSTTITIKGYQRDYSRIQDVFTSIDLSSNRFEGEIPNLVENLKGLQSLNLSHNMLTGPIPPLMGNMVRLESLDLSHNQLSGQIPQQLSRLNFLAIFDVSYNNLSGPIPQGNQFNNVDNSSYVGNVGLCGDPLSKRCGDSKPPSSGSDEGEDEGSDFHIGWRTVLIGYGCGMLVGMIGGNYILTRKQDWFAKTFKISTLKKWDDSR